MNSIEQYDKEGAIVEEIRLKLNHNMSVDKLLILCEDNSDCKYYRVAFDNKKVIFHPTGGCREYRKILEELRKYENRFIVLKDADFDNLDNQSYDFDNIFLTDTHDIETMLMMNKRIQAKVADAVIDEIVEDEKEITELINLIIINTMHFSYVKWLNRKMRYDLDVRYICRKLRMASEVVNSEEVINYLYMKKDNREKHIITKEELDLFERDNCLSCELDYFNIINGHDLLWLLSLEINNVYSKHWNEEKLGLVMLSAVGKQDILYTSMFRKIKEWQDFRHMDFLLKEGA